MCCCFIRLEDCTYWLLTKICDKLSERSIMDSTYLVKVIIQSEHYMVVADGDKVTFISGPHKNVAVFFFGLI